MKKYSQSVHRVYFEKKLIDCFKQRWWEWLWKKIEESMLLGREGEIQNMGQGGNYLRLWEELNEAVPNQR